MKLIGAIAAVLTTAIPTQAQVPNTLEVCNQSFTSRLAYKVADVESVLEPGVCDTLTFPASGYLFQYTTLSRSLWSIPHQSMNAIKFSKETRDQKFLFIHAGVSNGKEVVTPTYIQ